jgi:LSD1 subclass zinc finger protein
MFVRCSECREPTWVLRGWAKSDHCAHCGARLPMPPADAPAPERGADEAERDRARPGIGPERRR